jgi:hypothetical protein
MKKMKKKKKGNGGILLRGTKVVKPKRGKNTPYDRRGGKQIPPPDHFFV